MKHILSEIEKALNQGLYLLALQASLTLPDVCAAVSSDSGVTTKKKYLDWYNNYVKPHSDLMFTADDCYYFRCSFVHQGSTRPHQPESSNSPQPNYSRVMFLIPNDRLFMHNNVINEALNIDIDVFCRTIIAAVRRWEKEEKDTPNFQRNYPNIINLYPNGFPPYITGIPVVT